ncbi:hypothetical protein [Streptomyces fungicidicus]|uniref:hypothetical protein n=1 Tax=Streptomyces fungicidicus TaxID=68203 RepID=UPI0036964CE1
MLAPRRHPLPQGAVLDLGELAAVLGLGDGPDVVPDDVAAHPGWGSGGVRA